MFFVDAFAKVSNNTNMSTEHAIPAKIVHDLEQTLDRAMTGARHPEEMHEARKRMNQMREELRKRIGIVNIAVDLIRDARNQ